MLDTLQVSRCFIQHQATSIQYDSILRDLARKGAILKKAKQEALSF